MGTQVIAGPGTGPHSSRLPRPAVTSERGAVSAETAAVLPVLVAVVLGLVWLVALAATQVRVVDAAREVARATARGDDPAAALDLGGQVAPEGTRFAVSHSEDRVRVRAVAQVRGPGGLFGFWPGVRVDAESVAVKEPR